MTIKEKKFYGVKGLDIFVKLILEKFHKFSNYRSLANNRNELSERIQISGVRASVQQCEYTYAI